MRPTLVFCHGFGLDPTFFDPLKVHLKDYPSLDWNLGYFSEESYPLVKDSIAIGHSLGFLKLLEHQNSFKGLVSLGGFTDFIGGSTLRKKALIHLAHVFSVSVYEGLKLFYTRMGYVRQAPALIYKTRLLEDLKQLEMPYNEVILKPIFAIGNKDDPLVTEGLFLRNFKSYPHKLFLKGGHMDFNTSEVALAIKPFIEGLC